MYIKNLTINNIKSFPECEIDFDKKLNILIGKNNSGKSTIIQSLYLLQYLSTEEFRLLGFDRYTYLLSNIKRQKTSDCLISICISETENPIFKHPFYHDQGTTQESTFVFQYQNSLGEFYITKNGISANWKKETKITPILSIIEPENLFYPFFSKRKFTKLDEQINIEKANQVSSNFQNIYSKLAKISQEDFPSFQYFKSTCEDIFGFKISVAPTSAGMKAAFIIDKFNTIPIDSMGEGTLNLLGLIADLCVAENRVFLIEELENDIHPESLKKILDLIVEKSNTNQFIISTHSNIVLKHLGSQSSCKTFNISMEISEEKLPTSTTSEILTSEDRLNVLSQLGYSLLDFNLYSGYLILEESSAETIINKVLIPIIFPKLQDKIKTISAGGTSNVEPKFNDFLRLFVYVHTSDSVYRNKAWVIVDGDPSGISVIKNLRERFESNWPNEHFIYLKEHNFEKYYPKIFKEKVNSILEIANKEEKRNKKKELLLEVLSWAESEEREVVKEAFEASAQEVIKYLALIYKMVNPD